MIDEARAQAREALRIRDQATREHWRDLLRQAGLP